MLTWLLSYPTIWKHKRIYRDCRVLKTYLLLQTTIVLDFKVMTAAIFPYRKLCRCLDGFISREWIMPGGLHRKRKFVNDLELIRQTVKLLKLKRVSLTTGSPTMIGTNAVCQSRWAR